MSRTAPPGFNRLAWSNLAAQSAEQIGLAAAPIVAVLAFGAGAGETGLLQTAQTLPFLLLALPAGVLADRMSRRKLMACAEALRALSLAAILLLVQFGLLNLTLLGVLGFVGACGTVVYSVVAPALVPALVPPAMLSAANARIELARTVAFAGGPALAGALVGWTGAGPAFAFACALSVCAVFLLAGLAEPARAALPPRHPLREVRDGAAFVFTHPLLMPVFVTQVVFNTAFFMLQAMYVPYAINTLGLSAGAVGATLAALGVGMVGGALLAPRLARVVPFGVLIAIGPIAGVSCALVMLLTVWVPSALLAGLAFFLIGGRAGALGHQHRHAAPIRHAAAPARPGLGDVHAGAGFAADRRGDRRIHRRRVRRRGLPLRGAGGVPPPGRGDPGVAGHAPGEPAALAAPA